jgi:hypothetical protein
VRDSRYHGSFEHPVRAFLIGVTLLVLLFGGFVVGIEAGKNPIEQTRAAVQVVTTKGRVQTVTVGLPVTRTVIDGSTRVVTLPGSVRRQVVVIHRHGKTLYAYATIQPASAGDTSLTNSAATVYEPAPVTVTTPPVTSTETVTSTVTVTVTETAPPSSTDSSGTAQTGP